MEALTDKIEEQIGAYIRRIEEMGGTLAAIEQFFIQREIQNSSYRFQKEIESLERVYVGINKYTMQEPPAANLLRVDLKVGELEAQKLRKLRAERDQQRWREALDRLGEISRSDHNVMPAVIEAVKAEATIGEICNVWREIWGEYQTKDFI